jgi:hypothetical protein
LILSLVAGCGGSARDEDYATIDGTVKHAGKPVPSGAELVLEDKPNGVRMTFPITDDGKYEVNETSNLPAGTYAVAVLPPATESGVTEANYDEVMSNPDAKPKDSSAKDSFPVPEQFRDTETSKKTIEVKAGSQTIDIDF